MNGLGSSWTDDREATLTRLWTDGLSASQIAGELGGTTRNAVISKVGRLGLPKRRDAYARQAKTRANNDRSATMRIKKLRVRGPSNGGAQIVECVVREPVATPSEFLGIPLLDLNPDQCRFTNSESHPYLFCGQPVIPGQSWCRSCSRIVFTYTPPPVKRPYYATGGSKPAVF